MTVLIVGIILAWIIFSGFLVTVICMNSARLSRIDEPFKDPVKVARTRRREARLKMQMEQAPISLE